MNIVSRAEWGANPSSVGKYGRMPGAVGKVWVHHSVTASHVSPKEAARTLESIGMSRFGVFSYTFAIHPDGTILEGAGWNFVGAHTSMQNSSSYGFVFIGNYENEKLSDAQIRSFQWLVKRGKEKGKILSGASIDGHRHAAGAATACPGTWVINELAELRKPFRVKKLWVIFGTKKKRRVVRGRARARAIAAIWRARGYDTRIREKTG